jgi:hypothetical protein
VFFNCDLVERWRFRRLANRGQLVGQGIQ